MCLYDFFNTSVYNFCSYAYLNNICSNIITIPSCRSPDFMIFGTDSFSPIEFFYSDILKESFIFTRIKNICVTGDNIILFYTKEK